MPTICGTCWSRPATDVLSYDRQPLARMGVAALAREGDGVPQRGYSGGGGRVGLEFFLNEKTPEHFANEAVRQAIIQLDAVPAPAGEMTVVLAPAGPAFCCTKPSAMDWKPISTARAFRPSAVASASRWRARSAP